VERQNNSLNKPERREEMSEPEFDDDIDETAGFLDICPDCHRELDEIDFDWQMCSHCGWDVAKDSTKLQ
jgi:hypothetical protein